MFYNCRLYDYVGGQHVTCYKKSINKGIEKKGVEKEELEESEEPKKNKERTVEQKNHSAKVSYNRTKNRIYQIARSNMWDWFITLTFDRTRTDSSNYDVVTNKLQNFLEDYKKRKSHDFIYLIVPELHTDREHYHFHGLLANCGNMRFSYSGHNDKKGNPIFNMPEWSFGFSTATRVQDVQRVSHYITKYITKDSEGFLEGKKRYYCPHNIHISEPEYMVIDEVEFYKLYSDRIVHSKSIDIPVAGQRITYYELRK